MVYVGDGKDSQKSPLIDAATRRSLNLSLVNILTQQAEACSFNSLETRLLKGFNKRLGSNLALLPRPLSGRLKNNTTDQSVKQTVGLFCESLPLPYVKKASE